MIWSQNAKQALFGNDHDFLDHYCTETTRERLTGVQTALVRGGLWRLADTIPQAAHATPKLWTPKDEPQPIVVIGRLKANGDIREPKVGLCRKDCLFYLFARKDNVRAFAKAAELSCFEDAWVHWRPAGNGHDYVRSKAHFDCCFSGDLPEDLPLRNGETLWRFLKWVGFLSWINEKQLEDKWIISPRADVKLAARRPAIEGSFNGFDCIYPRLVEDVLKVLTRKIARPGTIRP